MCSNIKRNIFNVTIINFKWIWQMSEIKLQTPSKIANLFEINYKVQEKLAIDFLKKWRILDKIYNLLK